LGVLTARLLERGFDEAATRKVLGGNWMRIFREVWGS
jgi:microsomal dipeptidase-like Zn-dependent dipeptidase